MKKVLHFAFFQFLSYTLYSQVSVSSTAANPSGSYTTLKDAFEAINIGEHQGRIIITISGNTTETASAVLNASSVPSAYSSVTILPLGNYSITGNLAAPLIDLNGADSVIIDGRIGGAGTTRSLTITNSSASNSGNVSTIRLHNSAQRNVIRYCNILGCGQSTSSTVLLLADNTSSGSKHNLIDNNEIGPVGTKYHIYALASRTFTGLPNDSNYVTNNLIHDFFDTATTAISTYGSGGIGIGSGDHWVVTGNSLYHQVSHSIVNNSMSNTAFYSMNFISVGGGSHTISQNFIGGSAKDAAGGPTILSSNIAYAIWGVYISGSGSFNFLDGNTITNFLLSSQLYCSMTAIEGVGRLKIGVNGGNTIGSMNGNGAITINLASPFSLVGFTGIEVSGSSSSFNETYISNNNIGSVKISNTGDGGVYMYGVYLGSVILPQIQNNVIGGSAASSLEIISPTATVSGIYLFPQSNNRHYRILDNTVRNITNNSSGANSADVTGIRFEIGASNITDTATITGNAITNLSSVGNTAADGSVRGIYITQSASLTNVATNGSIANNQISNLSSQATGSSTIVRGIWSDNNYTNTLSVQNNSITNISSVAPNTTSFTGGSVQGIGFQFPGTGSLNVSGNTIYNLENSAAAPVSVVGIGSFHGSNTNASNISKNRIYNLRTPNNTGGSITGILLRGSGSSGLFKTGNNMISLQPLSSQPVYGIQNNATAGSITLAYNSVYIGGTEAGSNNSAAFYRTVASATPITAVSNLWQNHRSGGSGGHFSIINANPAPSTGWTNLNYNNFYNTASSNVALWGSTSLDLAGYKSASAQEAQSSSVAVSFANAATADLHLSGSSTGDQNLGGIYAVGFTDDYDGETRPIRPYKGADEVVLQPLPVSVEYFKGTSTATGNKLQWKTAFVQGLLFTIERSRDGIHFTAIGTVSGVPAIDYNFTDAAPLHGSNYYRLKIESRSSLTYSSVLLLTTNTEANFSVVSLYPVVTKDRTVLTLASSGNYPVVIEVYNSNGSLMKSRTENISAGRTALTIDVNEFRAGVYFVNVRSNQKVRTLRLVKE